MMNAHQIVASWTPSFDARSRITTLENQTPPYFLKRIWRRGELTFNGSVMIQLFDSWAMTALFFVRSIQMSNAKIPAEPFIFMTDSAACLPTVTSSSRSRCVSHRLRHLLPSNIEIDMRRTLSVLWLVISLGT